MIPFLRLCAAAEADCAIRTPIIVPSAYQNQIRRTLEARIRPGVGQICNDSGPNNTHFRLFCRPFSNTPML